MHALTALLVAAAIVTPVTAVRPGPDHGNGAVSLPTGWEIWAKSSPSTPADPGRMRPAASPKSSEEPDPDCSPSLDGSQPDRFYCGLVRPGDNQPAVTPQMLAAQAVRELVLPLPQVRTAPPRGRPAMVGVPQWFWLYGDGQWRPMAKRVQAGDAWAEVVASPQRLVISPGAGLPDVVCQGPGSAYDPHRPPKDQQSGCTYLYERSSAGRTGGVYQVSVTVVWGATWRGSGGAGGTLAPISRTTSFPLPVAEAQALVAE
ncbi:hypothetical protein ACQP1K_29120 (plasmid) [Sphaerimonospora sp. CA-214678]|uniref:hypothetical protein n=1 Tax=Sphaerimonospora sp. CA-214678 TaxID=3240029 RepID=UPI003D92A47C